MYSRYEPSIAKTMMWIARGIATAIAAGLLMLSVLTLIKGDGSREIVSLSLLAFFSALAFALVWRFPIAAAILTSFATLWFVNSELVNTAIPDYLPIVMLLPAFLSLGAWLRRSEYRVVTRYRDAEASPPN